MAIFNLYSKRHPKETITEERGDPESSPFGTGFAFGTYGTYNTASALTLSSVYRAVSLISNGIASLQMKVYDINAQGYKTEVNDVLSNLLGCEPNEGMGRYIFFKQLMQYKLLRGNAYILITRDKKFNPIKLELLNSDFVVPLIVGGNLKYQVTNKNITVDASNMIHIMNHPVTDANGITTGISTIQFASNSLEISHYSDRTAKEYFRGGANNAGILSTAQSLKVPQRDQIMSSIKNQSSMDSQTPNGVSLVGGLGDLKFTPFTISNKDSQLIESRQFNIGDIGRYFSVNPILLFDNNNVKANSAETSALDFLNTTLLSEIELLENEFTRKLLLPSQRSKTELRFDLHNLLRANQESQSKYYQTLYSIGVMSPNDIAKELNLPEIENGDVHMIPVNTMDIKHIIYNEKLANTSTVEAPVDNNLK